MNILVIVADTLRTAFLGCYGNDWIHTPRIDSLAAESLLCTRAHPEVLPTIPTRRTLHGGRRVYPFRDYKPVRWDNVYLPGWQPLDREEPAVAEALAAAGYHTGFIADVPHYFVPAMNFTRGFRQWQFVRGQAEDRLNAPHRADPERCRRYRGREERIAAHLVNVRPENPEELWPTARVFRSAINFVQDHADGQPFYLYVDSFTPHETWEAPLHYYDLYGRREDREPLWITVPYEPLRDNPELEKGLVSLRANYAGLVTMVDTWVGRLLDTVERVGLAENTLVILMSDHGTNFADNAERVTGKPADYMYPGTMDIPLIVRHPEIRQAARTDLFVSTVDVPATVLAASGVSGFPADGHDLLGLLDGGEFPARDYLTCRYGNSVWYRDEKTWFFDRIEEGEPRVFDLEADPGCTQNIAARSGERIELARKRIMEDAKGELRHHELRTDAIGR
jgi:arylsulfatase A-like enzyme